MTKSEFINQLRECLQGQVSEQNIRESLDFYRDYFYEQEQAGKTEEEILFSLGSPRLIAHSIIDANGETVREEDTAYYDAEEDMYQQKDQAASGNRLKIMAIKIGIVALFLLLLIVGVLIINALLPVILVVLAGIGIYKFFTTN